MDLLLHPFNPFTFHPLSLQTPPTLFSPHYPSYSQLPLHHHHTHIILLLLLLLQWSSLTLTPKTSNSAPSVSSVPKRNTPQFPDPTHHHSGPDLRLRPPRVPPTRPSPPAPKPRRASSLMSPATGPTSLSTSGGSWLRRSVWSTATTTASSRARSSRLSSRASGRVLPVPRRWPWCSARLTATTAAASAWRPSWTGSVLMGPVLDPTRRRSWGRRLRCSTRIGTVGSRRRSCWGCSRPSVTSGAR